MAYCSNCGAQNEDNAIFCTVCGAQLPRRSPQQEWQTTMRPASPDPRQIQQQNWQRQTHQQYGYEPQQTQWGSSANRITDQNQLPSQFRPLSAWEFFGYTLLYFIPIVGFILLIVFSFNDDNINRRNHARSFFCSLVLAAIIVGIFFAIGSSSALMLQNQYYS